MLKIEIKKINYVGQECNNTNCRHNPKYIANFPSNDKYWPNIRIGTICAFVEIDFSIDVYCRECIDLMYQEIKTKMDSNLWTLQ